MSNTLPTDDPQSASPAQWNKYMLGLYVSGKSPEPLGTVDPAEVEAKAREKMAKYPGKRAMLCVVAVVWGDNVWFPSQKLSYTRMGVLDQGALNVETEKPSSDIASFHVCSWMRPHATLR